MITTEKTYTPILKTGDLFDAETNSGRKTTYEFVGFAPLDETGCQYLIIRNTATGEFSGVEAEWFNENISGRKIVLSESLIKKKIEVVEVCPQCGEENIMQWDFEKYGLNAFCPVCGSQMMLCDECIHRDEFDSMCAVKFNGKCKYFDEMSLKRKDVGKAE